MKKVAIVTGASSGIGKATAIALSEAGYKVWVGARRTDKLKTLNDYGITARKLDVTDDASMKKFMSDILKTEKRIDILVNNAGYGSYGAIEDVTMIEARRQIEVNLFGLARMTQLVLPTMRKQKSGKVVNITSIGGKVATPFGGWYHASKFAVEGLSDSLRNEVKQFGIDVIVIEPGGIKTEWGEIAMSGLMETSGKTAYATMAKQAEKAFGQIDSRTPGPALIANLIVKAISAK